MSKKKVGLLVDSLEVSHQVYDLIERSYSAKNYEITKIILNNSSKNSERNFSKYIKFVKKRGISRFMSSVFFKLLCKAEQAILKKDGRFENFFKSYDLSNIKIEVIKVNPCISKNGLEYRYNDDDLNNIKNSDLNLLIRASAGIIKGKILSLCPNGIISFHHADNRVNRGMPAGFWEVYLKQPKTGFIIQRLKSELDGGDVLYKGSTPTNWFYNLNVAKLYEVANPFFHKVLEDLTSSTPRLIPHTKAPYSYPLYTIPTVKQIIIYTWIIGLRCLKRIVNKILNRDYRWGVAYQFTNNWNDATLWRSKKIENPKNRFLADPFLIYRNDKHYCFVEDFDYSINKAWISVYEITPKGAIELGPAIKEEFHLSYPYLFEYENELYMCPETNEKREIRLYRCIDFPLKWEYCNTLMKNVSAADSNIFYHGNKWWLQTNIDTGFIGDHCSQLYIFSASTPLTDQWVSHKDNPIIFDPLRARNGGLIRDGESIFRVNQKQGFGVYGESSVISKITEISDENYKEEMLFEVKPNFYKNLVATHTYNYSNNLLVYDYAQFSDTKTGSDSIQ